MIAPYYHSARVTLYLGDCIDVMRDMPDNSADAIITDLPYGTTACKWDAIIPFEPMWAQVKRVLKANGAFITTASQPFTSALIMSNLNMFRYELIYEKSRSTGHGNAKKMPMRSHENIIVFYQKLPVFNPQFTKGIPYHKIDRSWPSPDSVLGRTGFKIGDERRSSKRYPRSVIYINNPTIYNGAHPTQKPVALMEYLINTYTNEGDTVLDFCMGSGSTGVAAMKLNRRFIGIELSEEYCKIAKARIHAAELMAEADLFKPKG